MRRAYSDVVDDPSSSTSQKPNLPYPSAPKENDPSWEPVRSFLSHFHGSIFCYIPDAESLKSLPVTHADVLDIDKQSEGYGIFYSVNGFKSSRARNEANLLSVNAFYVDIDWPKDRLGIPKPDELAAFKRDATEALTSCIADGFCPTYIVETKNGIHGLWVLEEPIIVDNLSDEKRIRLLQNYQKIQLAIIDRFQGDPMAKDISRVLRLPNTWHLKNPKSPFRTRLLEMDSQTYAYKQLKNYFLSDRGYGLGTGRDSDIPLLPESGEDELVKNLVWKHTGRKDSLSAEDFAELCRRYPKTERPSFQALMSKDGIGEGQRNHSLLIAASAMRESGQSEANVLGYFDHYNGLSAYEIAHTIKSAFARPTPFSFGWNHPLVAARVTEEERLRVSATLSVILKEKDKREKKNAEKEKKLLEAAEHTPVMVPVDPELKERTEKMLEKRSVNEEKAYQKTLFEHYDKVIHERYPRLRYCLNSTFFDFKRGVYEPLSTEDIRNVILQEMDRDKLMSYRTETNVKNKVLCLKSMPEIQVRANEIDPDSTILNVRNGLVDFTSGDLKPHTPTYFSTNQLPVTFREGTVEELAPRWLRFVDEIMLGDKEKARFLQQMTGYCFTRSIEHQKAFILFGTGANGKSTFIDTIMQILGERNSSSLTLHNIHERFGLFKLFGKTLNVIEEISSNFFESDLIKKIITGSEVTADRKFLEPIVFRPYAKFVFAVNSLPRINDTSTGLYRRFHIIDFLANFEKSTEYDLSAKLAAEHDGIFLWCMQGWQDLVRSGGFIVPATVAAASDRFKESNSPIVEFLLRHYELVPETRLSSFVIPLMQVFDEYQKEVKNLGYQPKNFQNFTKELMNLNHGMLKNVGIVTMNGQKMVSGIMFKKSPPLQPLTPSFQ